MLQHLSSRTGICTYRQGHNACRHAPAILPHRRVLAPTVRVAQRETGISMVQQHQQQQPEPVQHQQLSSAGTTIQQQQHSTHEGLPHTQAFQQQLQGKVARFAAQKSARKAVPEQQRPLADYMALPASQYSVLDARKIERLDNTTFRCYVGRLAFFGFSVEPVITVSVVVEEGGCTIKLLSAQLQGSTAVQDINSKFTAQMTNVVRWHHTEHPATKEISSDTSIEVVVQVPAWFSLVPVSSIEAAGSRVMATTLNLMVPRFLEQLQKDYKAWAAGDESRKPVGEGVL